MITIIIQYIKTSYYFISIKLTIGIGIIFIVYTNLIFFPLIQA